MGREFEESTLDFDPQLLGDLSRPSDEREACWLRLHRHYSPRLAQYLGRRIPSSHSVEEVIAEVWRRAFLKVGTLRSSRAMWSWLTTIGNNLLTDLMRRDQVRAKRERLWSTTEIAAGINEVLEGWNTSDNAEGDVVGAEILDRLSSEEREFLELYAVDGLSHEEIAHRLGLPSPAASRQRLRRLRQRLAKDGES